MRQFVDSGVGRKYRSVTSVARQEETVSGDGTFMRSMPIKALVAAR
jgi:hypothetical protein